MQWSCAQTALAVAALVALTGVSFSATSVNRKAVLYKILGGNFTSLMRPVLDDSQTTQVSLRMTLYEIQDLDEKNQQLVVNVWLNLYWHDDFLRWDPNEFGNVTSIHLPSSSIWRPDIALYNSIDTERPSTGLLSDTTAVITSTGQVTWSTPVIIKSACRVDVADYPFDSQRCPLKFGSWTYNGDELNLTNFADTAMLDSYKGNGEWHLVGVPCERHEVVYQCCPEPYPDVTFTIVIKRRPMFYLFHLLFPSVLLTAIGLLTFCLPPESGEKVSVAVTMLLAMTVFMLVIMENIPATSEVIPLFGQFLGVTILVLALTTAASVLVMNAHFRGLRGHRPPAWVRKLFIDWLARFVCMRKMAYDSSHLNNDEIFPTCNSPHHLTPERPTMRTGKKQSVASSSCSSVANIANVPQGHINNKSRVHIHGDTHSTKPTYPERQSPRNGSAPNLTSRTIVSQASLENTKHTHITNAWTTGEGDHSRGETPPNKPKPTDPKREAVQNDTIRTLTSRSVSSTAILENTSAHNSKKSNWGSNTPFKEQTNPAMRKILDLLKEQRACSLKKTRKDKNDDHSRLALVEWQMVAMVTDRIMLVVFAVLVGISYAAIFSRIPA